MCARFQHYYRRNKDKRSLKNSKKTCIPSNGSMLPFTTILYYDIRYHTIFIHLVDLLVRNERITCDFCEFRYKSNSRNLCTQIGKTRLKLIVFGVKFIGFN